MSGATEDRTAYDVIAEIYYQGSPDTVLSSALCWLLKSKRLEAMAYSDFLEALEAPFEENELSHYRGIEQRRFELLQEYFLGESDGSKTNSDNLPGRHSNHPADSPGRGVAAGKAGGG